ncbi:amidohydrolase [Nocardioides sp.]|uniref:amidohydrolase n=2 Tax=Nocardioides sp. TaxID=35761 RepID=UPI0027349D7B|nr:amidohydrolase family protein [Nocardioides sp.]MDP3892060.1 amidohydrolase family protein [Nocardioides sp.]
MASLIREVRLVAVSDGVPVPDEPVDVLVEDGVVTAIGPDLEFPSGMVQVISGAGRWLMPGLWDQHVHLAQWTLSSQRLDLAPVRSVEEAVALVAERLEQWPDLPVIGWGHRTARWPSKPVVSDLDALDTEQPVILISGDGHHAWLNSVALMMLALPLREGMVTEGEWFSAYGRLHTVIGMDGTGPEAYHRTMELAAAHGVVGLVDFEFSGGVDEWAERWQGGADLLRIRMATYADGLDAIIAAGLRTGDPLPGCHDLAVMGPLKIISDGSLNTRTAWCCEPYAEEATLGFPYGHPNQTPEELRALLTRATEHGLEVAVHAIGDRAITEAVDAFAETGARGSIEHAQLTTREEIKRMAEFGLRASVQPAHLIDDRDISEQLWPGRGERCFALRWMADEGVEMAFGSDAPVSPLDPWLSIAAAVHRSGDERPAWHEEQSLTPREALAASTDGQGTVGVGSRGDLIVLDADPLAVAGGPEAAAHLRSIRVAATLVDGEVIYDDD